jgi:pimeloyl-ACP methyl ester carboxylesterase
MIVQVDGVDAHASTGGLHLGTDGSNTDPVVLLVHGAGMDSTVWQLQTRYLAYRGLRAIAVDLPGHGRSAASATPLGTVEAMADWVSRFIAAAGAAYGFTSVHMVGHSLGTFIGLELARLHPTLVQSLTLFGTATAMPVHPALLDGAANDIEAAAGLMASWSHDKPAHVGTNPTPGLWMLGGARALVENSTPGVLAADFGACVAYSGALSAAAAVACPATVVIGLGDKMTPPKSGRALAAALPAARVIELSSTGHSMMSENPRAVRQAIIDTVNGAVASRSGS